MQLLLVSVEKACIANCNCMRLRAPSEEHHYRYSYSKQPSRYTKTEAWMLLKTTTELLHKDRSVHGAQNNHQATTQRQKLGWYLKQPWSYYTKTETLTLQHNP